MNTSFYPQKAIKSLLVLFLFSIIVSVVAPFPAHAKSYFEDGYLGLTQNEIREKLGTPMAVRSRKAALRVFSYYTFKDWEKYFSKLVSPENGEDVYTFTRNGIQVRYSFVYIPDLNEGRDFPTLYVRRIEIEFTPAVPLEAIPKLVPEFIPPTEPNAPAFRSNLWVLVFKGLPSHEATMIVKERGKEELPWSLAYQIFSLNGIPDLLTLQTPFDRMEISTQSLQVVKTRQRLTHEPIMNPFSKDFAELPPPPKPKPKTIPVPQYAD